MNYYEVLGVSKTATQEEIKKAYKALVKQHHPDQGGDAELFKTITEAYETLKDPQKREIYDNPPRNEFNFRYNSEDITDIFNSFFQQTAHRNYRNRDIKLSIEITLEEVLSGKEVIANYKLYSGKLSSANIKIPAGIDHGEAIKYKGLGDNSNPDAPPGDLMVFVKILPHREFSRDGFNLKKTIHIDTIDLILGTKIDVLTLDQKTITINIFPGTNPGTILNVAGYGLPNYRTGKTGNLHLHLKGITTKIKNKDLLERLKEIKNEINNST